VKLKRELGIFSAALIIIADVIGSGIFMNTTGVALKTTGSAFAVLILWALGGLAAVTGSLCYSELASIWPDDGGEYIYLKKIFGDMPAFLTGWTSLAAGFTVSAALTSVTAIHYFNKFARITFLDDPVFIKLASSAIIILFGISHMTGLKRGILFQNILTLMKIIIVMSLIIAGLIMADWGQSERLCSSYTFSHNVRWSDYGSALIIIMYAYTGWNGAAYMAGEIKEPGKKLPVAMFSAALIVTVLYIVLNIVFLISSPAGELTGGEVAVGFVASVNLFGRTFSPIFSLLIAIMLISSVSAQIMVGPRVYYAMAKDGILFESLSLINPRFNTPLRAILLQTLISVIYVFIGSENIYRLLVYMGFALSVFPLLSVGGMVYLRYNRPDLKRRFRTPLFPAVPFVYITLTLFMMAASVYNFPVYAASAMVILAVGMIVFKIRLRYFASHS